MKEEFLLQITIQPFPSRCWVWISADVNPFTISNHFASFAIVHSQVLFGLLLDAFSTTPDYLFFCVICSNHLSQSQSSKSVPIIFNFLCVGVHLVYDKGTIGSILFRMDFLDFQKHFCIFNFYKELCRMQVKSAILQRLIFLLFSTFSIN